MTYYEILLSEGIGKRVLHHYTNYDSLFNILKSKQLNAKKYPGTKKGTVQVATVRPSMSSSKNLGTLGSATDGGVKFIIDASNISDSVRGAKINTIAEIPYDTKKEISKIHPSFFKNEKKLNLLLKKIQKFVPEDEKSFETRRMAPMKLTKVIVDKLKQDGVELEKDRYKNQEVLEKIVRLALFHTVMLRKREGEERITLKDLYGKNSKNKTGLPLNKKYIKIELIKAPKQYELKGLKEALLKNKNLFIQNDIYKKIVEGKE